MAADKSYNMPFVLLKKIIVITLLVTAFCPISSYGSQQLIWPLKIEISPSSSFMEARGFRFHGGVDLRTRKTTGFPVYAIADGFVSRIKIQHRGFGYALYVDHPQLGIRSVFGHLEDYAGPVQEYAQKKLAKMKTRYGIDDFFGPEKFPVKQGDIIAYTGESGLGPPHLHFELRTLNDEPISPSVVGYKIPDKIHPVFEGIWFEPLSAETRIQNQFLSFSPKLNKKSKNCYVWDTPVVMYGRVGIQAGIVDYGEGDNRFGVEKVTVLLDETVIFERTLSLYSYDENDQCPYIFDYHKTQKPGTGYVYTLFKWPFETMQAYSHLKPWAGVLDTQLHGKHLLKIVATDFGGNVSEAYGPIEILREYSVSNPAKVSDLTLEEIAFTPFSVVAIVKGKANSQFNSVICRNGNGKEAALPAAIADNRIQIAFPISPEWAAGGFIDNKLILPPMVYLDEKGGEIASNGIKVNFPARCLNLPILAMLEKKTSFSGTKNLPARSECWELLPDNFVTNLPMKIFMNYSSKEAPAKLAIYSCKSSSSYDCEGGSAKENVISIESRVPNRWIVLEDTIAPKLNYSGVRTIKKLGKCWVYTVSDIGEGVDYYSITAKLNGVNLDYDSDPDKSEIYIIQPSNIKGKVRPEVSIADKAGNRAKSLK